MMKKEKKKELLEIEGLMDNQKIKWKKIPCVCSQDERDVLHRFPIAECKHCKFQQQEDSMPRECWTIKEPVFELKNGKRIILGDKTRKVTKIKIIRGQKYDDVMGWVF